MRDIEAIGLAPFVVGQLCFPVGEIKDRVLPDPHHPTTVAPSLLITTDQTPGKDKAAVTAQALDLPSTLSQDWLSTVMT